MDYSLQRNLIFSSLNLLNVKLCHVFVIIFCARQHETPRKFTGQRLIPSAPEGRNGDMKPAHLWAAIAVLLGLWVAAMAFALGLISL